MGRVATAFMAVMLCLSMGQPQQAFAASTFTQTHRIVVRPVTATGHPVPGYTVTQGSGTVDCRFPGASPAAVDPNIVYCSPNAAYAVACWNSARPRYVLCLQDARKAHLVRYRHSEPVAQTMPLKVRAPLDVRLGDGKYCTLRVGGAGPSLKGHPRWYASYYCTHRTAIWARMGTTNWGINRTHKIWTVKIAPEINNGTLHTRRVFRAWFVGTHR